MKCAECQGACCESITIERADLLFADSRRWIKLHNIDIEDFAHSVVGDSKIHFDSPCRELTAGGACNIYVKRPQVCRLYQAGSPDCIDTVRKRRTPEEFQQIREEADPVI